MDKHTIEFLKAICIQVAKQCDFFLENKETKEKECCSSSEIEKPTEFNQQGERIIPVIEWSKYHSYPKGGGLRSLILQNCLNGSDYFVVRMGRKVLIDEKKFFEWLKMTQEERIKNSYDATVYHDKYKKNKTEKP